MMYMMFWCSRFWLRPSVLLIASRQWACMSIKDPSNNQSRLNEYFTPIGYRSHKHLERRWHSLIALIKQWKSVRWGLTFPPEPLKLANSNRPYFEPQTGLRTKPVYFYQGSKKSDENRTKGGRERGREREGKGQIWFKFQLQRDVLKQISNKQPIITTTTHLRINPLPFDFRPPKQCFIFAIKRSHTHSLSKTIKNKEEQNKSHSLSKTIKQRLVWQIMPVWWWGWRPHHTLLPIVKKRWDASTNRD